MQGNNGYYKLRKVYGTHSGILAGLQSSTEPRSYLNQRTIRHASSFFLPAWQSQIWRREKNCFVSRSICKQWWWFVFVHFLEKDSILLLGMWIITQYNIKNFKTQREYTGFHLMNHIRPVNSQCFGKMGEKPSNWNALTMLGFLCIYCHLLDTGVIALPVNLTAVCSLHNILRSISLTLKIQISLFQSLFKCDIGHFGTRYIMKAIKKAT